MLTAVGFGILSALAGCTDNRPSEETEEMAQVPENRDSATRQPDVQEPPDLRSGTPYEPALRPGEEISLPLTLAEGEWVELRATQQGLDVEVELFDPEGTSRLRVDSPIGREGDERLVAVAATAGVHRVTVRAVETSAPPGRVVLRIADLRPATDRERSLAEAERLFSRAENLRRQGTEDSRTEALETYARALTSWQELEATDRAADATHRLGWVQRDLGQVRVAAREFEGAARLYEAAGDRRGQAISLNALASIEFSLGEVDPALRHVRKALDLLRNPEMPNLAAPSLVAGCLATLGKIYSHRGETAEALEVYGEALTLAEAQQKEKTRAVILSNLGFLFLRQDMLAAAEDRLREAADLWQRLGNQRTESILWRGLGDVARRQSDDATDDEANSRLLDQALDAYRRSLDLAQQAGDERGIALALDSLGVLRLLQERYDEAQEQLEQARQMYRELELEADELLIRIQLGRLQHLRGDFEAALALHRDAQESLVRLGDPQLEASNRYGLARALWRLGRLTEAAEEASQLLDVVETVRAATRRDSVRMSVFASKQQYYELAIDIQVDLAEGDGSQTQAALTRAFVLSERKRARALLDLLGEERELIEERVPSALLEQESLLQAELNFMANESAATDRELRALRERLDAVRADLRAAAPDRLAGQSHLDPKLVAPPIPAPDTQYLVYSLGEERSHVWLVSRRSSETPGAEILGATLPPRAVIEAETKKAHAALRSGSLQNAEANRRRVATMAQILLNPVRKSLQARRLVVVADGALLNLPFGALPFPDASGSGGDELIRRHEIVHLPSVAVLRTIRWRMLSQDLAPDQLLIFADPVFSPPGGSPARPESREPLARSLRSFDWKEPPPLPGTRQEARAIEAVTGGTIQSFLGHEATKERLLSLDLSRFQILHLATHGMVHRDHPELSGLLLSFYDEEGERLDGHLRLHEIYGLDLRTELVVLSACQTGAGRQVRGEGLLGLSRGFFHAGSPRLVVSHWDVGDRSTMELMRRFYFALLEMGVQPAAALRAAQISMLESGDLELAQPAAWAGFTFQGDWKLAAKGDPFEPEESGADVENRVDVDYPTPGEDRCDALEEEWQREVCRWLRKLRPVPGGQS